MIRIIKTTQSLSFEEINSLYENFVNNEYITFNTLKECKQWILTSEAEEIKNKYTRG